MSSKDKKIGVGAELREKWSIFLSIVLSPAVLILLLAVAYLIVSSSGAGDTDGAGQEITVVVISIFSGLVGALIAQKWSDLTEAGVLVTRGKSAIRGLKLLVLNIGSLEARIVSFLSDFSQADDSTDPLARVRYEELAERCNTLQEEAINSIEEWTDIIPGADFKTQIGLISEIKGERVGLLKEIETLKEKLEDTKKEEQEEKEALRSELLSKEEAVKKVQQRLREKERELSASGLGGINLSAALPKGNVLSSYITIGGNRCYSCGNTFASSEAVEGKCPKCGNDPTVVSISGLLDP